MPFTLESGTPIAVGAPLGARGTGSAGTPTAVGAPARGVGAGTGANEAVGVGTRDGEGAGAGAGAAPGAIGMPSAVDALGGASIEKAGTADNGTPTAVGGAAGVAGIGAVGTLDAPVGGRPGDVEGAAGVNAAVVDIGTPSAVGAAGFGSEGGASHSSPARIRSTEPGSFSVLLNSARVGCPGLRAVSGSGSRVASSIVTGIRRVISTSIVFPQ
jgi:hypothetical protein